MALTMDSLLKLPTSKKVLVLVIVLGVITGLYFYSFYRPRQAELKVFKRDLNKMEEELNKNRAIAREYPKFKEQLAKLDVELQNALTQIPSEKEIPEILKNIASLGKESNLEFTLFRPKPDQPQSFVAVVPIELKVSGSYHNVGIFFDRVGKLPRIINVVDFNMTRVKETKGKVESGKVGSEILLNTSCLINTYRVIETKVEEKKGEKKKGSKTK